MNNFHDPDHYRFQHEYAEGHTNDSPVDLSGREGAPREQVLEPCDEHVTFFDEDCEACNAEQDYFDARRMSGDPE